MSMNTDHILKLAEIIREVDGNHRLGAAALAEAILSHPGSRWIPVVEPEPEGLTDEPLGDLIDKWVQEAFRKKPYGCKHPTHTYVACKAFEHGRNHEARAYLAQPEPEDPTVMEPRGCPTPGACSCPTSPTVPPELIRALELAEAALADIGDAEREPGDDLAWAEARAAQDLPRLRSILARWGK